MKTLLRDFLYTRILEEIMLKVVLVLAMTMVLFPGLAGADSINVPNTTVLQEWHLGAPTGVEGYPMGNPALFNIPSATATWSGNDFSLSYLTHSTPDGRTLFGRFVAPGDVFLTPAAAWTGGNWNIGVNTANPGLGNMWLNPTYQTSSNFFGVDAGVNYAGAYKDGTIFRPAPVNVTGGNPLGAASVTWTPVNADTYEVKVSFIGMNSGGSFNGFFFLIAGDFCANPLDFGFVQRPTQPENPVPIPATLVLLASGLLGFGAARLEKAPDG